MSDAFETKIETPCPQCGLPTLYKMEKKDNSLFMGVTPYIVFCEKCPFEENADVWQKRLESK